MRKSFSLLALALSLTSTVMAQSAPPEATLELESLPARAMIFLDHTLQGKGKVKISTSPGTHLLRVAAGDEYEPYLRNVELSADHPTRLKIQLAPSAGRFLQQGRALLSRGDFEEAARVLRRCQDKLPVESSWWQGIALWKAGHNAEALAQFRRYAQFITDSPELYLFLGLLHSQLGQSGEAYTAYKTALMLPGQLGPDALKDLPAATYESIKAMGKPAKAPERLRLAQLLMLKGQNAQALAMVTGAVQDQFGTWTLRDWSKFEPKLPPRPEPIIEPGEEQR